MHPGVHCIYWLHWKAGWFYCDSLDEHRVVSVVRLQRCCQFGGEGGLRGIRRGEAGSTKLAAMRQPWYMLSIQAWNRSRACRHECMPVGVKAPSSCMHARCCDNAQQGCVVTWGGGGRIWQCRGLLGMDCSAVTIVARGSPWQGPSE